MKSIYPKNEKLKWVIMHFKWLLILTIAMGIFLVFLIMVSLDKKKGYTELHRQVNDLKIRVEGLEK